MIPSLHTLTAGFCALLGLVFGSFLNVCIERLPRHQSVVTPRSRCPQCGEPITAFDNIPLLSWLLLKGRCRSCNVRISWRYSFGEAATGVIFVTCYLRFGLNVESIGFVVFCFLLLGLAIMDAETMLLPDAFTLPGIALGVLFASARHHGIAEAFFAAFHSLLAASLAAGLMLLIRWIYWLLRRHHGLGLGDAKLLAMIAAWLWLQTTLVVFFLAVVAAAVFAVGLYFFERSRKQDWLSRRLPLGSFLASAAIYSVFFGEATLKWYLGFFP